MSRAKRNVSTRSSILASEKRLNFSGASHTLNETMRIYFHDFGMTKENVFFATFVEINFFLLKYSDESRKGLSIWAKLLLCVLEYNIGLLTVKMTNFLNFIARNLFLA